MLHVPFGRGLAPLLALCLACLLPLGALAGERATAASPTQDPPPLGASAVDKLQQLQAAAGSPVTVSRHPTTGAVHFVTVGGAGDLYPALTYAQEPATVQLAAKSDHFFADYGALFGLSPAAEMRFAGARQDPYAATHLAYQEYGGPPGARVPVFGAILRTHFDAAGRLTAANGVGVPVDDVNTTPTVSAAAAGATAVASVKVPANAPANAAAAPDPTLHAVAADLFIFAPALLKSSTGPVYLAWRVEVVNDGSTVRRFVFVDAHTGKLLLTLDGIHELEREVSEGSLANKVWDEGSGHPEPIPGGWAGGTPAQVTAWNNVIAGAKETYNLFGSMTNGAWLSYNSTDAVMRTVNNDPRINCPNANWNSTSTNYCTGVTGDDTVAHEWAHAYTEYTSSLVYAWQAGALNESYSDIWGEIVDLLNSRGLDSPNTPRTAGSCSMFGVGAPSSDSSYRWLSGEDDPAFGGAIRDMWNPTCYSNPGKVTDADYTCDAELQDSGGVHTNSGVPNHLFALLVDGGIYSNITVGALGLTRAAHIHWQAQSTYLTPISDFFDDGVALQAACSDLIGQPLYALTTGGPGSWGVVAPETISAADCTAVANAVAAVQLATPPTQCNLAPILNANAPALCKSPQTPAAIYHQDWETSLGGWTAARRNVAQPLQFGIPNWSLTTALPTGRTGQAVFGADPVNNGDNCQTLDQSGINYLQSPPVTIPAGVPAPRLAFDHWVATEAGWDGGNVKIRINNGAWNPLAPAAILFNGYNANLTVTNSTNPLAGEPAFTGSNSSSARGSWGQTQVDLSSYAHSGDTVELRFELGYDACGGLHGWYVDDVRLYSCSASTSADVALANQVTPATALPGQGVTFELAVTNPSALPVTNIVLTATLPVGLAVNSFTPGGTLLGGPAVRWPLASLAAGSSQRYTVTATVDPAIAADLTLTATASLTAADDSLAANNTAAGGIAVVRPALGVLTNTVRVPESAGQILLPIALSAANPYAPVAVTYVALDGTAAEGSDYTPGGGAAIIAAGTPSATIPITIVDDAAAEGAEQFQVQLTAAPGARITQDIIAVQIVDDDMPDTTENLYLPLVKP